MTYPTSSALILAVLVTSAARLRERSYDTEAAQAATDKHAADMAEWNSRNLRIPLRYAPMGPDYQTFYTRSLRQCAALACAEHNEPGLEVPVYLLLAQTWNDSLEWSEQTVNKVRG